VLLKREARTLAGYEADVCRRFDRVVTVTGEDRRLLQALCADGGRPMTVIPICVDPAEKPLVARKPDARRVLILGTMFWPPNVEGALWFAREVWPRVLRELSDALLTIVGKNPPPAVQQLAGPNVEVTGYVADPTRYLEESAVFLVPLRAGGGMRVKILDAWCWGIPIVSTTIGAEGIEVHPGENILIADDAPSFAREVIRLLKDPPLAERLRRNGRQSVEEQYNWRTVYAKWDEVYAGLAR
jgi:glycosyltransferase involved in cell wall biosynthesis